jgi:uncharacterized protein (DUF1501 family)
LGSKGAGLAWEYYLKQVNIGSRLSLSMLRPMLNGGGLPTRVFYVSQGGYDTHTNQANTQERLL